MDLFGDITGQGICVRQFAIDFMMTLVISFLMDLVISERKIQTYNAYIARLEAEEIRTEVFSLWKQFISTSLAEALQQRYLPAVYAEAEYLLWNHFYQNWHITLKSRRLLQIGERSLESFRH